MAVSCEHDNEYSSSVEGGKSLDHLTGCKLSNKDGCNDLANHVCLGLLRGVLQRTLHACYMLHLTFLDLMTPTVSGTQYIL